MVSPQILKHRKQYIDHADEPETANPALEQFNRYHRESVTLLMMELGALLGLVLFSAAGSARQSWWIRPCSRPRTDGVPRLRDRTPQIRR